MAGAAMERTVCRLVLAIGVWAWPGAPAAAQQKPPARALTALDYAEIHQLIARYSFALDTCADNGYQYAGLYTPDGVDIRTNGDRYQGREKLAEVSGGGVRGCQDASGPGHTTDRIKHMAVNIVIEPSPEGARGKSYLVEIGAGGQPTHVEFTGWYQDSYVKTAQGWRFKSRAHILEKAGAPATP